MPNDDTHKTGEQNPIEQQPAPAAAESSPPPGWEEHKAERQRPAAVDALQAADAGATRRLLGEGEVDFAADIDAELAARRAEGADAQDSAAPAAPKEQGDSFWSESDEKELARKQELGTDEVDFAADIEAEIARQKEEREHPKPAEPEKPRPEYATVGASGDGATATGYCPKCAKTCERMRFLDDGKNAWVFCMACGWSSGDKELIGKMRAALASGGN